MPELHLSKPTPKQREFLRDEHKFLGFGGARGGGKSHAIRTLAVMLCYKYAGIKILIVRKTYPELQENHIKPLTELLNCYGKKEERFAGYNDQKKEIRFPNGSSIIFRYLETAKDAERFQGTEVDVLFLDEATQHEYDNVVKLNACVRGVNDFPSSSHTANPGGAGHQWFKRLFIDRRFEGRERPEDYGFIQSSVYDNKPLLKSDPDYIAQLEALPPHLKEMWLYGNWDVYEGQFFEDFRLVPDLMAAHEHGCDDSADDLKRQHRWVHVIEPFDIPQGWRIYRSYDFGYGKPFSCAWWAIDYDGVMYRILELYGCTKTPNEGVKWSPDQQFKEIARIEREHPWLKGKRIEGVADPAIWDASRGESIEETAVRYGVYFTKGDNERLPGWMQCHYRLQFDDKGYARCYIFSNCEAFIRTIPLLIYDEHKPEDLDTDMKDHCLVGDTEVLTEFGVKTIAEMVGTEGRVYSSDGKLHRYFDVRMTRAQAKIVEIELEDGTTIKCTDDHRFMLPNGEWIHAKNLSTGMELKTYDGGLEMKVKSIKPAGYADVYNMEVEDTHDFIIQGGVIAHNCADDWRYMCMSRPVSPIIPVKEEKLLIDPLNIMPQKRRRNF